jgi:hypothetical protein
MSMAALLNLEEQVFILREMLPQLYNRMDIMEHASSSVKDLPGETVSKRLRFHY